MSEKVPTVRSTYGRRQGKETIFKKRLSASAALSSLPATMLQSIKDREDRIHKDILLASTKPKANRIPLANITNTLVNEVTPSFVAVKSTIPPLVSNLELSSSENDSPILTEIEEGGLWDNDPQRMQQVFDVIKNQQILEKKVPISQSTIESSTTPLSESPQSLPAPLSEATIKSSPYRRQKPITPPDEVCLKRFDIWDIEEMKNCAKPFQASNRKITNVQPSQLRGRGFWMRKLQSDEIGFPQRNLPDHFFN